MINIIREWGIVMEEIVARLFAFQFVTDLIDVAFGAGLCFGALKWRRGSLTWTSVIWGLVLGLWLGNSTMSIAGESIEWLLICALLGAVIFPTLTYTIPGVNRFVLGYIFGMKFTLMITTVLFKDGAMEFISMVTTPVLAGTIIGLIMMAWIQMRVLPFVLCCTFIGASQIAPTIVEWINRGLFVATGDASILFDPIDLIFALFKIELTDSLTLGVMIILMAVGCVIQLNNLTSRGISYNTPIIGFEVPLSENGKIITE